MSTTIEPHPPESDELPGRLPPQDLAAEQSALGGMLLSKDAIGAVCEVVRGEDFYRPAHQTIYAVALDLYGRGEPVDAVTMAAELDQRGLLDRVGGAPYLHTLIATVPTAANADYYAEIVAEKSLLRRLAARGENIAAEAYAGRGNPADLLERAQVGLLDLSKSKGEDYTPTGDLIEDTLAELEAIQSNPAELGTPTGYTDLDDVTNGLHPGQLMVVAARPGMGKSVVGLDIARHVALCHRGSAMVFSLEMGKTEIMLRLLSAEAQVRTGDMRGGRMTADDWQRVRRCTESLTQAELLLDDSPNLTMTEIRAKARRRAQAHGLDLIVVDYLQLMASSSRAESRQQEVSEFSRSLKLLAKELNVPVVALSQLNRGPEARQDHVPQLGDLRESGAIEQDADLVMLIHRPDAYERQSPRAGEADLILAKHRAGPTATITVAHQLHYSRFADMARE
jgi:replicative DNA helicase